ncbi:C40 family peptidase [Thomasclavelia sp.]
MEEKLNKKLNSFINENIIKRKAMFIPILGVSVFMLVGYAAVDKEAPVIVSNRIEVAYGEKLDLNVIDITDNHDQRDELVVNIKENNIDVMQLGTYELTVSVSDCSSNESTKTIAVEVVDDEAPQFKIVGADKGYVVQVPINGSSDVSSYITAIDNVDGDVSPFIETDKELDATKPGIQDITLSVTDSSGNVNEKMFEFAVSDLTPPSVTLTQGKDIIIDYGSEFNLDNYLVATDDMGIVTNNVIGTVDTRKENEIQTIKVSTKDEAENEVVSTLNFTVKDISGPQINLTTVNTEVVKGDLFDPRSYLVSAIDNKDGDVTANVEISNIDTNSTGDKSVTYTVSDTTGNKSVATLNVKVYTPGTKILETAYTKLGSPYVWGATGPNSFDCSGFTSWVYRQHGISLSRTAQSQSQGGTPVERGDLQAGDLVFFGSGSGHITHVGIYIGDGQMVHSPQTGDVVKISALHKNYVTARRYL